MCGGAEECYRRFIVCGECVCVCVFRSDHRVVSWYDVIVLPVDTSCFRSLDARCLHTATYY